MSEKENQNKHENEVENKEEVSAESVNSHSDEKDALSIMEEKLKNYEDLLKRNMADFDNFRKRNAEEREKLKDYATDSILLEFLPIFDNIERALDATKKDTVEIESIIEGLQGIMQLYEALLTKNGIEKVDSVGCEFDPTLHEALFTQEGDHENKKVIQEVEKAYKRKDKVLRTAKVGVGVPKKKE